ncbi:larval/pupal cuticle protein H1C-like [Chironomus tepperi]|uniref:larval/pupal cuticle protein H1C-like n=1 Tax=Chironomus tepperi TaxID=113505 RepID=UPI00391EF356
MAFKFVVLCSVLAVASAGLIEPAYTSYSSPIVQKSVYAAPAHSSSYTKTVSYTEPKAAYVSSPAVATYSSYDPHHYHHEPAHAVIATPHYEHGQSEQNIVRSAHGTVSQISKSVDTPTSSVRKYVNTNVSDGYKTVSYAPAYVQQPAVLAKTAVVSQPAAYVHHQPATTYVQQPTTYVHQQPTAYVQQPTTYVHQQPATYVHQPATTYVQQPAVQKTYVSQPAVYAQHAPVVAAKIQYSPAVEVAHVNFESPIAHYGW